MTTLATNLAVCLAERSPGSTILIDLDTRQSDIATFLNLRQTYSVLDALENLERLDESFLHGLLVKHASGLWVLPGPTRIERSQLPAEQVQAALEIIRSHFGHVVLDLRHDFDPGTIAALEASDTILYPHQPRPYPPCGRAPPASRPSVISASISRSSRSSSCGTGPERT